MLAHGLLPVALRLEQERKVTGMELLRYAFIKANWHAQIVSNALEGFCQLIPREQVDVFDVPGAFEMPLLARDLARTGRYAAVAAAAFVVNGGIYRHEFVAQAVVDGLMRAGFESNVPVLSISLTPHSYHETEHYRSIFVEHFILKGREAAEAALMIQNTRAAMRAAMADVDGARFDLSVGPQAFGG